MRRNALSLAFVVPLLFCSSIFAADWYSCAEGLNDLRQTVSDAEDAARDVDSKADAYEQCKLLPIMDVWNDSCRTVASGYRYKLSNLQSELEMVNQRIRSVSASCSLPVSTLRPPASTTQSSSDSR